MAIKLDCPRCKGPLSVPNKKIGRYVNCPRCGGRFWVPENAATASAEPDATPPSAVGNSAGATPDHPSPPLPNTPSLTLSMGSEATVAPGGVVPEASSGQNTPSAQRAESPPASGDASPWAVVPPALPPKPPAPAAPSASGQKTARFVTAEAAQSTLKLADDGQLPALHLREGEQKQKNKVEGNAGTTVHPLLLFGLLAGSVALCIGLVLVDAGSSQRPKKDRARRQIEERFFPPAGEQPLEYQEYLMQAQRAHTRGDGETERRMYQRVLDLLRQEHPMYAGADRKRWSLTTTPEYDEDLEELISILLSKD